LTVSTDSPSCLDIRWIAYRLEDDGAYALSGIHPDGNHAQSILPLDAAPRYIDWGPTATTG
jgi:hypothetical protein